jgi:flagellar biosynthesis protein
MGKRKLASAIGYDPADPAPQLLASGRGREAERIIAVAQEAGVAVVEDTALAALLDAWAASRVDGRRVMPGDFIPPWCWEAAAKILAFIAQTEGRAQAVL